MKPATVPDARRTASTEATRALGREVGRSLSPGAFLALSGPLGSGKTTFARGVAEALGADPGDVASPTFVLLRVYRGRIPVYHLDAYRLGSDKDLREVGLGDLVDGDGVVLLEWADKAPKAVPEDAMWVKFENLGGNRRGISFSSQPLYAEADKISG